MSYSFNTQPGGLIQVVDPTGKTVGTGTPEYANSFGYTPPAPSPIPSEQTPEQRANAYAAADVTPPPTYGSVTPAEQKQPATEPAVVSSSNIDNVIPDNANKLQTLSQKGSYLGQDGNMYYSDGSLVPAPPGAQSDGQGGWTDPTSGTRYGAAPDYVNAGDDPDLQKVNELLSSLKMSSDASTKMMLDSIHQQFDQLRTEQQDINTRTNEGRQNALLVGGASRYAPMDESGTMNAQMTYGLQQIASLDAKENVALAQAKAAQDANNQKLMDEALGVVTQARQAKQAAAATMLKQQQDMLQKQQDTRQAAMRDTQIADIVNQGITDPAKILQALNGSPNAMTGTFTMADIENVLKTIATNTGSQGIKGLTGDVGNFYTLKESNQLPPDIAALPPNQQLAAYIQMLNEAKSAAKGGDFTLGANSVRYDANGKIIATGSKVNSATAKGGGSTGQKPVTTYFSKTQLAKGASNANAPLADFQKMDVNTQNYFINTYPSSQLAKDIKAVGTTGGKTAQQIANDIADSNLPTVVKTVMYNRLGVKPGAPAAAAPHGFDLGGIFNNLIAEGRNVLGI